MSTAQTWGQRHGLTPDAPNDEYANWLVPGVGLAPVTEFRILITLFVLVIGPVNYWLLKRMRRLHLLVITVPLAAALLTAALFLYALLADGLGTKVRVRSLTLLDQRRGEAASWARLSYYAGLAPSAGLSVSMETAIYPICPDWFGGSTAASNAARELVWRDDSAQLTRGWLRSRTPTQYLTIRSHSSPLRLQVRTSEGRVSVRNNLAANIQFVVLANSQGASSQLTTWPTMRPPTSRRSIRPTRTGKWLRFCETTCPKRPGAQLGRPRTGRANDVGRPQPLLFRPQQFRSGVSLGQFDGRRAESLDDVRR